MFGRSTRTTRSHGTYRQNRIRGLRSAVNNPRTTHTGRTEAKAELLAMGAQPNRPTIGTRIRHFFGLPAKSHHRTGYQSHTRTTHHSHRAHAY